MKLLKLPTLLLMWLMLYLASCSRCIVCKNGQDYSRLCDSNLSSSDIENFISANETTGATCREGYTID
ncbi:MAG: hypothetical protein NZM35_09955 [Chitinophagales bacterium]|nr:hypothetical protein [Chitinophagales bacterium]MDW8419591.1 hypothetical protein [Chitinophagales bacterium]